MFQFKLGAVVLISSAALVAACGGSKQPFVPGDSSGGETGPQVDGGTASTDGGTTPVDGGAQTDAGLETDAGIPDAGVQSRSLTLLTINLWHDFPTFSNLDLRTQMVADFILQTKPDLVAVQEVGESGLIKNRCKVIGEKAGYDYRWVSEGGFTLVFAEGPCVLSRWPIIDEKHIDLPHPQQSGLVIRKALATRVQWSGGPLTMVSTHLSNGSDVAADRLDQAAAVYGLVRERAGALPVFLGGDFNSDPDSPPMKFLRGQQAVSGVTSTMLDAWLTAHPNGPGLTASAMSPDRRIDYLYMEPGTASATRVVDCEVVLDQAVNGIYPSDHFGVLCRFEIDTPAL